MAGSRRWQVPIHRRSAEWPFRGGEGNKKEKKQPKKKIPQVPARLAAEQ